MRTTILASTLSLAASSLLASETTPDVDEILARAIEVQRLHEEAGNEVKYDYELLSVTEKLDKEGAVDKIEKHVYRSNHIQGVAYERLVEKDGRELTKKEKKNENEREEKFRQKLAKGEARHNDSDERVDFNEELLARFDIHFGTVETLGSRDCYVLHFTPKPGKLPEKRRIDRVLNEAEGSLWIDRESYEIARVEFDLRDKVKLWWGVMGSVSSMSGQLDRRPVGDDETVWLPEQFDFYIKGRLFFRSLHLRQKVEWNGFRKRDETAKTAAGASGVSTSQKEN